MKSGKLRRVITLQFVTGAPNQYGTPVETWADFATLRAELVTHETTETVTQAGAEDQQTAVFRTRFIPGVTNAMRISFAGELFNVRRVRTIGNDEGLEISGDLIGGAE